MIRISKKSGDYPIQKQRGDCYFIDNEKVNVSITVYKETTYVI